VHGFNRAVLSIIITLYYELLTYDNNSCFIKVLIYLHREIMSYTILLVIYNSASNTPRSLHWLYCMREAMASECIDRFRVACPALRAY